MERVQLKNKAKKIIKKHYLLLILVCLIASFIGTEFSSTLSITSIKDRATTMEMKLIRTFHKENLPELKKKNKEKEEAIRKNDKNEILSRKNGVFSQIINSFDTGSIYVKIIEAIYSIVDSFTITVTILIILSLILMFLLWFFVINVFQVISRRIFLEARIYTKIPSQRFLFLQRTKCWCKVSRVMFVKFVFQSLWYLTIIGGIIKRYSYFLVPFIVAENPNITARDAINLSKNMMNGHKMECFKLEFSFILWDCLGYITVGLSNIFFLNPYKISTYSEYYSIIRREAINNKLHNYELLNDKYLFEKADKKLLDKEYENRIEEINHNRIKKTINFKEIINNDFGIRLRDEKEENEYEKEEIRKLELRQIQNDVVGNSYPIKLFPNKETKNKKRIEVLNYIRRYSVSHLIIIFFIISVIGWVWEVALCLIQNGIFVNRGAMHGPWLPIYGYGGLFILIFLYRFRRYPFLHMIASIILCGSLEYFTSWSLEVFHNGQRWWDYSGYFLNLNGRICAEGLLIFGLGGMAVVYLLVPILDNFLKKFKKEKLYIICILLVLLYIIDYIYSGFHPNIGEGITDYNKNAIVHTINKQIYSIKKSY